MFGVGDKKKKTSGQWSCLYLRAGIGVQHDITEGSFPSYGAVLQHFLIPVDLTDAGSTDSFHTFI